MKKEEAEKKLYLYFDKKNIDYPVEITFLNYENGKSPVFLCKWKNGKNTTYVVLEKGILALPR